MDELVATLKQVVEIQEKIIKNKDALICAADRALESANNYIAKLETMLHIR